MTEEILKKTADRIVVDSGQAVPMSYDGTDKREIH